MTAATVEVLPEPSMPLSTKALTEALIRHYRKPGTGRDGEILITEPQAPGSLRRCDLVRIGVLASRATGIDAHEVKVSRSDWLRELGDPLKADAWWPYCSRWWIVALPDVVDPVELPVGWGLMEPSTRGRRFRVRVQAVTKEPLLSVGLLEELLRRSDNQRLGELDALRDKHRSALYEREQQVRSERVTENLPYRTRERLALLDQLETALGMELVHWASPHDNPSRSLTPVELAEYLTDARDHVTLQRHQQGLDQARSDLLRTAKRCVADIERPVPA